MKKKGGGGKGGFFAYNERAEVLGRHFAWSLDATIELELQDHVHRLETQQK